MITPPSTADNLAPAIDAAGKYRLGPLLGAGGMAEVYRGHIAGVEGFERVVAIKRVLASYSADERFAAMFISEARLASLLTHPCVVSVIDFDRDRDGRLFQIIEFVNGVDLEKLAAPGEDVVIPEPIIIYILGEVLEGLRHAHQALHPRSGKPLGIVHRDCTPSNVLITWDGVVKLSDFGIAKAMQATAATASGTLKGKPMYMAPEQITAEPTMDGRVDLFAVGVMLWELLTGSRPFVSDTAMGVVLQVSLYGKHEHRVAAPHEVTRGRASVALSNLAMRLMAPRPEDRPADAQQALVELRSCGRVATRDELAALLADRFPGRAPRSSASFATSPPAHSLPTSVEVARARGPGRTAAETIGRTPPPVGDLDPVVTPPRSRSRLVLALGAAVLAAGAAVAIALSSGGDAAGDAAERAAPLGASTNPSVALDAGTSPPLDAVASPDAPAAPPTDASISVDAVPPIDAGRSRPSRGTRKPPSAGSGSGHGFIEKTIGEGP